MIPEPGQPRSLQRRRLVNRSFLIFCIVVTSLSILSLGVLLVSITIQGLEHLDLDFVKNPASRKPEKAMIVSWRPRPPEESRRAPPEELVAAAGGGGGCNGVCCAADARLPLLPG